jgi:hypothetical protein
MKSGHVQNGRATFSRSHSVMPSRLHGGACPPEDCGGILGYQDILKILRKKKLSQDDRELLEWLGG